MPNELQEAWTSVFVRLTRLAAEDPALRADLRQLAQAVLAAMAAAEPQPQQEAAESLAVLDVAATPLPPVAAELHKLLTFSGPPREEARPGIELPRTVASPAYGASDDDLPLIEARCRAKAEGARWAASRERRLREGADFRTEIEPLDRQIIDKAKQLPDCFLWMNHSTGPSPEDLAPWDDIGGCFETLADGITLVRGLLEELDQDRDSFEQALDLIAEAQSAVRASIMAIDGPTDSDQSRIFNWLRSTANQQQLFIRRYMRADDPADPAGWSDIDARISQLDARVQQARQRDKQQQARMKRVRYHVKPIMAGRGTDHDWRKVVDTLDEMVREGLPPSNREVRDLISPVIDDVPEYDELPQGFELILREIDRYLAARPAPAATEHDLAPSAAVQEAARLLGGCSVVLIGGERRPDAQRSLRTALGLKELVWVETREHQSLDPFEAYVARPDVAVVVLAIRWSSHSFGDVKQFCDRHGKPLVRLPAGYNPNQVAAQILAQCSGKLAGA